LVGTRITELVLDQPPEKVPVLIVESQGDLAVGWHLIGNLHRLGGRTKRAQTGEEEKNVEQKE
jgi:hypothetical protein